MITVNYIIVKKNTFLVYECFETLEKANDYLQKKLNNNNYEVEKFEDYCIRERDYYIKESIKEISEDDYIRAMEVLPPIKWMNYKQHEVFCNSEALTGVYHRQYTKRNLTYYNEDGTTKHLYYTAIVDIYDKNTWVPHRTHNCIKM